MTHPGDAILCQRAQGWGQIAYHDIERKRRSFHQARDQNDVRQTRREESVSSSFCIRVCSLDGRRDHSIVVLFRGLLEKDVSAGIDK